MKKIYKLRGILLFFCLLIVVGLELIYLSRLTISTTSETVNTDAFTYYMELSEKISADLMCFPIIKEDNASVYPVSYDNSWGAKRTYGGDRTHEGCDLMAVSNERGRYKVCSMTDGVVKNIGWLEQGGWRIGIESDNGIYYYYAHLDSYEKAFEKGERIVAGQILGRMGDSGYGKTPGTTGNFAVHLHVGIYVRDLDGAERAVNPYWYLKRLEI